MVNIQPTPKQSLLEKWFSRGQLVLLLGIFLLLLGVIYPWYQLPSAAIKVFGISPTVANLGRGLAGLFAFIGLLGVIGFAQKPTLRLLCLSGLLISLLFPYYIVNWSPRVSFLANTYYEQGNRVSRHVDKFSSEFQAQWGQSVDLDRPTEVPSTWALKILDSHFFQMPAWQQIWLDGMGYSNDIFQFIGKGWILTVTGLGTVLFGLYLNLGQKGLDAFLKDMLRFLPGAGLVLGAIVFSLLLINVENYRLETLFAKGDYRPVVTGSEVIAHWYPPAQGDADFLRRWAIASSHSKQNNEKLIQLARGMELYENSDFQAAEQSFREALELDPRSFIVRGYLASAILQQGINYINDDSKKPAAAATDFEEALQIFPMHLEALYDLMLAHSVNGAFEQSASIAQQIIQSQQYFQQPETALLGRAYTQLLWSGYNDDHIVQAWKRYRQSVDTQSWSSLENEG